MDLQRLVKQGPALLAPLFLAPWLWGCGANTSALPCGPTHGNAQCPTGYSCSGAGTCTPVDANLPRAEARAADGGKGACGSLTPGVYFVDADTPVPVNGETGSQSCPFKTITQALKAAGDKGGTLKVAAGTYSTALGETFPLLVGPNDQIVPSGAMDRSVVIDGAGGASGRTYTVALEGSIQFATIQDTLGPTADAIVVVPAGGAVTLAYSTVVGGALMAVDVSPVASSAVNLTLGPQDDISGASGDGVHVGAGAATASPTVTITGSAVHGNGGDGVRVDAGQVTVGPAVTASLCPARVCPSTPPLMGVTMPQSCSIYCNKRYGIEASVPVAAESNWWDHDTPSCAPSPSADFDSCQVDAQGYLGAATGACFF